jgi:penicillin-binding protein 1B
LGQDGNRAIHGFGLGARFIFGKRLTELSIAETALLIGMIKAPSSYNPRRNPQAALARRNVVLKVLLGRDVIDRAQYDAAIASPLRVADANPSGAGNYAAYVDLVQKQLVRDYGDTYLQQAGLDVYTSLDPMVHGIATRVMEQRLNAIDKASGLEHSELETAMVIADPRTGEVISLIGGRHSHQGNFNRALNAHRPIGSLVKPFIYLTALEQQSRFNVVSTINDAAVSVPLQSGEVWTPKNYDNKLHGQVSLLSAFTNSYNLATVNLGLSLGLKNVIRRLQKFGIEREFDHVPSVLLGALNLTPFEVTQLYQGIANDGFRIPLRVIRSVANDKNEVLQRFSPSVEQITTPANAVVTQYLMSQVVENGTGRSARTELRDKLPLAGKTGTSNDERDSWFAGFSRNFLAVIWVGHDDNTETGLTGSSGALKLWTGLMKELDVLPIVFSNVEGLQWHRVNSSGSAIVPDHCADLLYVPLALPHGLPVLSICDGDDVPEPEGALRRKLRGWFR